MKAHYDIAIIGGGLAGTALALALLSPTHTKKVSIALIDKNNAPEASGLHLDGRALALSFTSVQCLKTLKLWSVFAKEAELIKEVQISAQGSFGVTRITASRYGLEFLGAVLNADSFNYGLHQALRLKKLPESTLQLYHAHSILRLEKTSQSWELEFNNGKKIQATLLVGADGTESFVRQYLGIGISREIYTDCAITTNVKHTASHLGIAFERFAQLGSIAFLPLEAQCSKCVVIVPKHHIEYFMQLEDKHFLKYLQKELGFKVGLLQDCSKRIRYNLQPSKVDNIYGLGWVLIGNAANTLHPIAAQGFNLALRDIACLAEIIFKAQQENKTIDNIALLQEYAQVRYPDQQQTRQFTQYLSKHSSFTQQVLRKAGLLACELISPLQQKITQAGLGTHISLPKLSRRVIL